MKELQLYLSILESQNKTLASIKLMSSELAQLCKVEFERQRLTVKYLKQDGHLSSVYDICKDMLLKKNFSKFSKEELESFALALSYLLPEARKKGVDDEATFEQFLLKAF